MTEGYKIDLYMDLNQKKGKILLYDYLLEYAKENDLLRANVFKSIAGYEKKGKIEEESFIELGKNLPIIVSLILKKEEKEKFFSFLKEQGLNLFYAISSVETGLS